MEIKGSRLRCVMSGGDEEEEEGEKGVCVAHPFARDLSLEPEKASLFEILRPNQLH